MNEHLVEQFENKLLEIIATQGTGGDGKVTISAEDLLLSIRLYKNQIHTIEKLEDRIESLQYLTNSLESSVIWQMRFEKARLERDAANEEYVELYNTYARLINESVGIRRQSKNLEVENNLLYAALYNIAVSVVDNPESLQEYAQTSIETVYNLKNQPTQNQ